ncbi:MAG: hypothetical protein AB7O47_08565 [Flavobacteriales bacterium]
MKGTILYFFIIGLLSFSCSSSKNNNLNCNLKKITFNIKQFDERGLMGDEKMAIDFEFCLPDNPNALQAIKEIDSSIKPLHGKGRTKCAENHIIMIGNSYNKDIKNILCKLSQLDYITEINQVFWE